MEDTFSSLQEEVQVKTKKLKKLVAKLEQTKAEIADIQEESYREKEDFLETIRELTRELTLKEQIMDLFIPPAYGRRLRDSVKYDEQREEWVLATVSDKTRENQRWPDRREGGDADSLQRPISLYGRWNMASGGSSRYRLERLVEVPLFEQDKLTSTFFSLKVLTSMNPTITLTHDHHHVCIGPYNSEIRVNGFPMAQAEMKRPGSQMLYDSLLIGKK